MEIIYSIGIASVGLIASYAVMKSNVTKQMELSKEHTALIQALNKFMNEKQPLLSHLSKTENEVSAKLESMGKDIVSLQMQLKQTPTMKEVRLDFVSKEVFLQMEKHFDEKFDLLQAGIYKILDKLEKQSAGGIECLSSKH